MAAAEPVHERILRSAKATPRRIAIEHGEESFSYADLREAANAVREALLELESRDLVIGIAGPPSFGLVASALGVFLRGGTVLFLDDRIPPDRRRSLLRASGAAAVVTPGTGREVPRVSRTELDAIPLPPITGAGIAYLCCTSGTSGRHRLVAGTHAALAGFLAWQSGQFGFDRGIRGAQLTGLSFDVVFRALFQPLYSAGVLCLPPCEIRDSRSVLKWLSAVKATSLDVVPSVLQHWIRSRSEGTQLPSLRLVFLAGEPLHLRLVERARLLMPRARFINLYGPSETTLARCFYEVPPHEVDVVIPVGRPIAGTTVAVEDGSGKAVDAGCEGEIVIRTSHSTFFRSVDLESGSSPAPDWSSTHSTRPYRSGDIGRFRSDGQLQVLGRTDDQLKIGGVRVHLPTIACEIERHPAIHTAVVLPREDDMGGRRLLAFVVTREPLDTHELRIWLSRRVPWSHVPWRFVPVTEIPLTANGKVDSKSLYASIPAAEELQEPQGALQEFLLRAFEEATGGIRVGVHDNLFERGADSLVVMTFIGVVQDGGIDLRGEDVYVHPTIAELARVVPLGSARREPTMPSRDGAAEGLPMSLAEERFVRWSLEEPRASAAQLLTVLHLRGPLRTEQLARALDDVVRRIPPLRYRYRFDGRSIDKALSDSGVALEHICLPRCAQSDWTAAYELLAERVTPFDLGRHCFQAVLISQSAEEHVLGMAFSHAVCDQASREMFAEQVAAHYSGSEAPGAALDYLGLAHWERTQLASAEMEGEATFWKAHFAGSEPLNARLPHAVGELRSIPRDQTTLGYGSVGPAGSHAWTLGAGLADSVRGLAARHRTTPFAVFLGAYARALALLCGTDDIIVSSISDYRDRLLAPGLFGLCGNLVLLRLRNPAVESLDSWIRCSATEVSRLRARPEFCFIPRLQPRFNDFFRVEFNYARPRPAPVWKGLCVEDRTRDYVAARPQLLHLDLGFNVISEPTGFSGSLAFNREWFEPEAARQLLESARGSLTSAAEGRELALPAGPVPSSGG